MRCQSALYFSARAELMSDCSILENCTCRVWVYAFRDHIKLDSNVASLDVPSWRFIAQAVKWFLTSKNTCVCACLCMFMWYFCIFTTQRSHVEHLCTTNKLFMRHLLSLLMYTSRGFIWSALKCRSPGSRHVAFRIKILVLPSIVWKRTSSFLWLRPLQSRHLNVLVSNTPGCWD